MGKLTDTQALAIVSLDGADNGAMTTAADAASLLAGEQSTMPLVTAQAPYLIFFHPASGKAAEVRAVCPHAEGGQPFVIDNDEVLELPPGWRFTVLQGYHYWAEVDSTTGDILEASERDPGRGSALKENLLTIALVDTGERLIPTLTTWRSTKTKAAITQMRAVENARRPEWVTLAPTPSEKKIRAALVQATTWQVNGQTVDAAPMRVWSTVAVKAVKSRAGFTYHVAHATPKSVDPALLERVTVWLQAGGFEAITAVGAQYLSRQLHIKQAVQ